MKCIPFLYWYPWKTLLKYILLILLSLDNATEIYPADTVISWITLLKYIPADTVVARITLLNCFPADTVIHG